ncbi:hypothetical protein GCM10011367_27770 [Marinicauda pacifica]|nr:hypothetical protein GCM10011367_27770 [Marinicauda pacifica]
MLGQIAAYGVESEAIILVRRISKRVLDQDAGASCNVQHPSLGPAIKASREQVRPKGAKFRTGCCPGSPIGTIGPERLPFTACLAHTQLPRFSFPACHGNGTVTKENGGPLRARHLFTDYLRS